MVGPASLVYLRFSGEKLHRSRVVDAGRRTCTVVRSDAVIAPGTGRRVFIHYDRDGEFVRQAAVVEACTHEIVELRLVGEAASAERRRKPRVSYLHVLQQVVSEPLLAQ